jgi:Ca-activated chloride channel homolog
MRRAGLAVAALLFAAALRPVAQFSASVDLVEAYVTVVDRSGRPVEGLQAGDFELTEDGRPQDIQAFAAGDFPLAIALAIDHSSSMAGRRLTLAVDAARGLLDRLRPDDQAMVIGISSDVEIIAPLSVDRDRPRRALAGLQPWGATSLNDAIATALDLVRPGKGRRALIVLSDGQDRYSLTSEAAVLERARRAGVLVYPVAFGRPGPALFPRLAVLTGGRSFQVDDPRRLTRVIDDISRELRYQYLLGYAPARARDSEADTWHTIQVRVRRPDVQVRARDGYYGR